MNINNDNLGQQAFFLDRLDRNKENNGCRELRACREKRDVQLKKHNDDEREAIRMQVQLTLKSIAQSFPARLRAHKPEKANVVAFANHFITSMSRLTATDTEENLKVHLMDLLKQRYQPTAN